MKILLLACFGGAEERSQNSREELKYVRHSEAWAEKQAAHRMHHYERSGRNRVPAAVCYWRHAWKASTNLDLSITALSRTKTKRSQRSCELPTPSSSRLVSMSTYLRSDPVHGCDPLLDGTQRKRGFTFDQMRAVDQPVATRPFHLM